MKSFIISLALVFLTFNASTQDTFSIVAIDGETGEVGSAGASCVDLLPYPNYTYHFLGELIPGIGAINTQAYYLANNQLNARNKMLEGLNPQEIINWLVDNDVQNNPSQRQYGIVGFVDGETQAAGYTGNNTDDYKNHLTGVNYSIQGNILLGPSVLEQMESNFINANGDLACKLMAALQGANMVGADTRCASNGTSSLFAFIKVAQNDDEFGDPSFILGLKTANDAGIEPIDSLQILFDEVHSCSNVGLEEKNTQNPFTISPNPAKETLNIQSNENSVFQVQVFSEEGKLQLTSSIHQSLFLDISHLNQGLYFIKFSSNGKTITESFVKL